MLLLKYLANSHFIGGRVFAKGNATAAAFLFLSSTFGFAFLNWPCPSEPLYHISWKSVNIWPSYSVINKSDMAAAAKLFLPSTSGFACFELDMSY